MICRECGEKLILRSHFDACCTECGSEDLDEQDAYDPVQHELQCDYCGYEVDVSTAPDRDWSEQETLTTPTSVDDPCPICGSSLVPRVGASSVNELPEYGVAREAARKVREEHGISGPPFDVEQLAGKLGLEVATGNFEHDGMLVGEQRIEVPADAGETVRRFVIAHETGHFVLRHRGERSKVEPEANAFASELLIPRDSLKTQLARTPSARALRAKFNVSRQAMVYALMSARLIDQVRP